MASNRSNTDGKLPKAKKVMPKGKPFNKGYDPRRNLKGRPRSYDQLRELGLDIAEQIATSKDGQAITWNGQEITFAEFIMLGWAMDKRLQERFIAYTYGNVPQDLNLSNPDGTLKPEEMKPSELAARAAAILELLKNAK